MSRPEQKTSLLKLLSAFTTSSKLRLWIPTATSVPANKEVSAYRLAYVLKLVKFKE